MLVQNSKYPEFVADQLLTSENLNDLFGYLDEQGRITRTNLIGIGIVCGLEVKTAADGSSITITKGTGVTSEGYMVTIPETTYTDYVDYDSLQEEYYEKFVNIGSKTKKFEHLWELKQAGVENSTNLSHNFLNGNGNNADKKVVLLFVELLKIGNKNCNPNSCDDKGISIEITIRPLLARKADVDTYTLKTGAEDSLLNQSYISLDEKRIKRFDVTNTDIATSADVFTAYKKILSQQFLNETENLLTSSWNVFRPVIGSEYNNINPFSGLASAFSFLNDGTLNSNNIINMQYYYDHFSDLLAAYDEFRIAGMEVLSMCCPDSSLFPRHLLLDLAIKDTSINYSQYRHYFIYSPLFQQKGLVNKLKMLFRRMVLMRTNFSVPAISGSNSTPDAYVRVTPSRLDASAISYKAIPYYYRVNNGVMPLFKNWSYEKSVVNAADKNLSYHAQQYSGKDFVVNPLQFDLEPYNFLRIEGIVGKQYTHVLRNLKQQIYNNRLPTDVIAISTDNTDYDVSTILKDLSALSKVEEALTEDLGLIHCHFNDLESVYISIKNEMLCTLCKELKYYYEIPMALTSLNRKQGAAVGAEDAVPSEVALFSSCSGSQYLIKPNTFGVIIEKIYKQVGDKGEVTLTEIMEALGIDITEDKDGDGKPDIQINAALITAFMLMMPILEVPIYIIRLSKFFTEDLHDFDVEGYCTMQALIAKKIKGYKTGSSLISGTQKTEIKDAMAEEPSTLELMNDTAKEEKARKEKTDAPSGLIVNTNAESIDTSRNLTTGLSSLANIQNGMGYVLLYILILEDLYDHLDVLAYNCKCKALNGLKEEYLRRITELAELRQLRHFNQRHPGMQHKAGVTMGGTFIIIYHSPISERTITNIKDRQERVSFKEIVEKKTSKKISEKELDKNILKLVQVLQRQDITVIEFIRFVEKSKLDVEEVIEIINEIDPRLLNNIKGLKEILTGNPAKDEDDITEAASNLKEGIVIADFYLPYLCYSCCPPIVYQVQDIKEEPVEVFFSLQPDPETNENTYSITDENEYSFTVSPKGGTINNGTEENGVYTKGDSFMFVPSKIGALLGNKEKIELKFTYSYDGVTSDTITATVYNVPVAEIVIDPKEMPQAPGTTFKIISNTKFADKFTWAIDGKDVSDAEHLGEQSFKEPGTYKISLSVRQSATGATAVAKDVSIEILGGPTATITSKPTITSAIPVGSAVHFDADVTNADVYSWQINNKEIFAEKDLPEQKFEKAGTYVYRLIVKQKSTGQSGTSNTITVVVAAEPQASIITSPTTIPNIIQPGTSIVFNGNVQNADVINWELKNKAGEVLKTGNKQNFGTIPFNEPGSYQVTLTVKQSTTGKSANATPVNINVDKPQVEMSADISLIPATIGTNHPVGTRLNFTSKTVNVDSFAWFMNGNQIAGATAPDLKAQSFPEEGTHFISLRGKNNSTGKTITSNTIQINIFKTEEPTEPETKNCGELNDVSTAFIGLKSADSANYSQFHETVLIKMGIASYFEQLIEVATAPGSVQLEFFEENITIGQTIDMNLRRWLAAMADIVANDQQKAFHFLAAAIYKILMRLAMYISCIQNDDVDKAKVPMAPALQSAIKQLQLLREIMGSRSQNTKDQINAIPKDVSSELKRMQSSNINKPNYKSLLETILEVLS